LNKDIRLITTFPRHPKTIKLKRILGTWEPIITLWLWAAENRSSGNLEGMEVDDIAIASGWDKDALALVDALVQVRFIEKLENGAYLLHGWEQHNAYAAASEKRSEKARLAARARWEKKLIACSDNAKPCSEHATSNAPSPSPSPSPSKKKVFTPPSAEEVTIYCTERKNGISASVFIDHYQARGWKYKTGQPMADWKAAVRTWEQRNGTSLGQSSKPFDPIDACLQKMKKEHEAGL
jgi:hypothetical protein